MSTKKELRARYKRLRAEIPAALSAALSTALCRQVAASPEFRSARTVHLFLPIRRLCEVDTYPLLDEVFRQGKTAVVSVSDFSSGSMTHYRLCETDPLAENAFGIPEPARPETLEQIAPAEIDLVVVPLLAYDVRGRRVGYGRGFYDRFLRLCRPEAVKAGVSFFPPEADAVADATGDDVPLDCCFTPEGKITWDECKF